MRGVFADGMVRGANGGEIIVGEFFHGDATHVVPEPVGIYFVADDVVPNATVSGVSGAVSLYQIFNRADLFTNEFEQPNLLFHYTQ